MGFEENPAGFYSGGVGLGSFLTAQTPRAPRTARVPLNHDGASGGNCAAMTAAAVRAATMVLR